jgi:glucokinase
VRLENDANMAALGEWWRGAGAGKSSLFFVALGTGIGGGAVVDGRLLRGSHGLAGEVGYTCLGTDYLGMDFGTSGCLEHLAAAPGVVRRARDALGPRLPQAAAARDVFDLALAGDPDAIRVRDETAVFLGIGIANAVALLDPEIVVLGGGMSQHGEPLLDRIRETVREIVPLQPEIRLSALGEEAQLYGAVFAALETDRGGPPRPIG